MHECTYFLRNENYLQVYEYFREPVYVHEYKSRNQSSGTYIRIDMETYEDARHDPTETVTYLSVIKDGEYLWGRSDAIDKACLSSMRIMDVRATHCCRLVIFIVTNMEIVHLRMEMVTRIFRTPPYFQ